VLGQVASGLLLARQAGLFATVWAGHGTLPEHLSGFPAFAGHYVISRLLVALIVLHILGMVYHRIVLRQRLVQRMAFGSRANGGSSV
jgi:cytochrome b561